MNIDLQALCARLGLATLNGLYQGILTSLLVAALLRLSFKTNAATRHVVWFATLCLVTLLIPAHFWLDRPALQTEPLKFLGASVAEPNFIATSITTDPAPPTQVPVESAPRAEAGVSATDAAQDLAAGTGPAPATWLLPPERLPSREAAAAPGTSAPGKWLVMVVRRAEQFGRRILQPVAWTIEPASAFPVLAGLMALWSLITSARLTVLTVRLHQVREFAVQATAAGADLRSRFDRLRQEGRVRRAVELRISVRQRCPMVLGFFRPVVLLPAEIAARGAAAELEQVLRHELAHVRRYDDWANLAQHFVQALLFFHPSVWWIGRRLSLEREIACDDHVLAQGSARRGYALVLTNVAGRLTQRTPLLAPGVSNSNNQLQQRISMILNTRRNASPGLAKGWSISLISATALLTVLALYSGPRLVAAPSDASGSVEVVSEPDSGQPQNPSADSAEPSGAVVAAAPAPPQGSPDVDPGPKFKAENHADEPSADNITPPEPPAEPNIHVKVSPAPHVARAGKAPKTPRMPEMTEAPEREDGSLEDRVRRLEKMIAKLTDQQGIKRSRGAFVFNDNNEMGFKYSPEQMDNLKQSAERQARASEQAQRAVEQTRRASKELEARLEKERAEQGDMRESFQRELESLRQAREGLGREMERLSRQIEKLEREQRRENQERHSDSGKAKMHAQTAVVPEIAK